jgi:hypothetical protein
MVYEDHQTESEKNSLGQAPIFIPTWRDPKSQIEDPDLAGGTKSQRVTAKAVRRYAPLF